MVYNTQNYMVFSGLHNSGRWTRSEGPVILEKIALCFVKNGKFVPVLK
jgi:hypothetical protein